MARLPTVGGDYGNWGTVLNEYLATAHNTDGTLKESALSRVAADTNNTLTTGPLFWAGSQEHYDALGTYDANTLYFVLSS